ncbi:Clampless protein 1 [Mycena sanguinolenta]|uniref:Clampless protein 1 n=1 Tax=Mycena sanguinolenta TaxID=230812 RepID=A0A8H7DA21_9AGAR|nr:Clampless protein 1 [Mycena sanguinolenta]
MFQVASHPAAFQLREHSSRRASSSSHSHSHSYDRPASRAQSSNPALQLPRNLSRPAFTDISRDALAAAAPDLVPVPSEFIRHGLLAKSSSMQAECPSHLNVPLTAGSAGVLPSYPTHVLAISASPSKSSHGHGGGDASLFPVHAVVLAAHCAKLPPLPPAPVSSHSTLTLPVLPINLPSPPAFAILHAWMYTGRLDAALGSLLPLPAPFLATLSSASSSSRSSSRSHGGPSAHDVVLQTLRNPSAMHPLQHHLFSASGGNVATLLNHAAHVKELWQDMVALGVYDPALWDALDLAWEVVLGGMGRAAA